MLAETHQQRPHADPNIVIPLQQIKKITISKLEK